MAHYRYLQLNPEHTLVIGESTLTGEVDHPDMYYDPDNKGFLGMKYNEETDTFSENVFVTYEINFTEIAQNGEILELAPAVTPMYYADEGILEIKAEFLFSGNIDTGLNIPTVKAPIVRFSDNKPTTDEVYAKIEVVNGVLTGSVNLPRSGDWRIEDIRLSKSVAALGVDWKVSFEDLHIVV